MPRTSSRFKGKSRPSDLAQPSDPSSMENSSSTGAEQAQKKRKVSAPAKPEEQKTTPATSKMPKVWKGVKGKRGLLKKLVDMPCDILLEIFGHLTVSDLHTLAASAKALRAMLLNRSLSYMLWKDAFARLAPAAPPCPEEISLPQYASFLYSRHCFTCNSKVADPLRIWECLSVVCKGCLSTEFTTQAQGEFQAGLVEITPRRHGKCPGTSIYRWQYFCPTYRNHVAVMENLKGRPEEQLAYVNQERAKLEYRRQHQALFNIWASAQYRAKVNDQQARRDARENAIVEKLKELGYGDVLQRLEQPYANVYCGPSREKLPLLKGFISVKPLTDKEWDKIRPQVVEIIEKAKQGYVQADRKDLILRRTELLKEAYNRYLKDKLNVAPCSPPVRRLAKLEPFRTAIYDTATGQDDAALAVIENFDNYQPVIDAWKAHADEVLRKLMGTRYVGRDQVEHGLADIYRPGAAFKCTRCNKSAICYPEALTHLCLYAPDGPQTDPNVEWDFNEGPSKLERNWRAWSAAREVTNAYEVDFETVTCKELDDADTDGSSILECARCERNWLHENWRKALSHELSIHTPDSLGYLTYEKWRRQPVSKLPELRAKERISIAEYADYYSL